jgi:hypothetical protein
MGRLQERSMKRSRAAAARSAHYARVTRAVERLSIARPIGQSARGDASRQRRRPRTKVGS